MKTVLLLIATRTYRAKAFLAGAARLGLDVVVGTDRPQTLADKVGDRLLVLDFTDVDASTEAVVALAARKPLHAILSVDDQALVLAAAAAAALGIRHNSTDAVATAVDKHAMRVALQAAGVPVPRFQRFDAGDDPDTAANAVSYPCVLKPVILSASRGVIRADDTAAFARAFRRIQSLLADPEVKSRAGASDGADVILVESFVPGPEVALEGLLARGELRVLALFDKPDPLDGPFFPETHFVTPSRHPAALQQACQRVIVDAVRALNLRDGPLHAELRLGPDGPVVLEVAPRSIGGQCSRALRFADGSALEEIILREAIGSPAPEPVRREVRAAGVTMLHPPAAGVLQEIRGVEEAEAVPGIDHISITAHRGEEVVPLPEGARYLGFVFARGESPGAVERSLRAASDLIEIVVTPVPSE